MTERRLSPIVRGELDGKDTEKVKQDVKHASLCFFCLVFFFQNVFIFCSFTYLTDHPRSITGTKMSGRITKEEKEEMAEIFKGVGEFDLRCLFWQFILTNSTCD